MVSRVKLSEVLPLLSNVREFGTFWRAACPVPGCTNQDLAAKASNEGWARFNCPHGHTHDEIMAALIPNGAHKLTPEEIAAANPFNKATAEDVLQLTKECAAIDEELQASLPQYYVASGLQLMVLGEPTWAVVGYFSAGVALVVAHSKIGKSYFVLDAAVGVALGGKAWGAIDCRKGTVIYVDTEGNKRRMQRRLRDLLGESEQWPKNLLVMHDRIPLDESGLAILRKMIESNQDVRMLVLDTLNAMRPSKKANGDLVKQDYDMIRSLRALGEEFEVAIVLVHHCALTKKDDSVNAGAGTHGLAAAASAILTMERVRGEKDGVVSITGNDIEEERKDHFVRQKNGFWCYQGSADQLKANQQRQEIFDLITENGPMKPTDIAKALKKGISATKMLLRRMAFSGDLIAAGGFYEIPERQ